MHLIWYSLIVFIIRLPVCRTQCLCFQFFFLIFFFFFFISLAQSWVCQWQISMDGFHIWNMTSLGHNTLRVIFGVERLFGGFCGKKKMLKKYRTHSGHKSLANSCYILWMLSLGMYTLWDLLGVIAADTVCTRYTQVLLLIFVNTCYSSIPDKPLEIDP